MARKRRNNLPTTARLSPALRERLAAAQLATGLTRADVMRLALDAGLVALGIEAVNHGT